MIEYCVDGTDRRAPLWIPDGFDLEGPASPWIVFLHCYEERGDANEHLEVGLAPVLRAWPKLYRVPVLLPQCPASHVWSAADEPWYRGEPTAEHHIDAAIDAAVAHPALAPEQIALTGASMGGFATLLYGSARPGRFARFHAVCGGGEPDRLGVLLGRPVWLYHACDDDVVPVESSRRMASALRTNPEFRYTELDRGGHACWESVYSDPCVAAFLGGGLTAAT